MSRSNSKPQHSKQVKTRVVSLNFDDIKNLQADEGSMLFKAREDTLGLISVDEQPKKEDKNDGDKLHNDDKSRSKIDNIIDDIKEDSAKSDNDEGSESDCSEDSKSDKKRVNKYKKKRPPTPPIEHKKESSDESNAMVSTSQLARNTLQCKIGDEFFYQLFLNNSLVSVCYGVVRDRKIHYAVLFDKKTANKLVLDELEMQRCVSYFMDRILADTSRRRKAISKDKPFDVEFQIDMSGRFPLLNDYSFLTQPPLRLRDRKRAGVDARLFDIRV